jgi:prepilin-type processing-associated H-X9-DG protein
MPSVSIFKKPLANPLKVASVNRPISRANLSRQSLAPFLEGMLMKRNGLTLVETLVSIGIIGLLISLLTMAVQAARQLSYRTACAHNLSQIGKAIESHVSNHGMFPPGAAENGFSLHVTLLPYIEQSALVQLIDFKEFARSPVHNNINSRHVDLYVCPVEQRMAVFAPPNGQRIAGTSYAGNFGTGVQEFGYNGVYQHMELNGPVSPGDVRDGLSRTIAMSEILMSDGSGALLRMNWYTSKTLDGPGQLDAFADLCMSESHTDGNPWARGRPWTFGDSGFTFYNHVLTPNKPSCLNGNLVQKGGYTAASMHASGVNSLYADGHVEFVSERIGVRPWRALGSRNGGEINSL